MLTFSESHCVNLFLNFMIRINFCQQDLIMFLIKFKVNEGLQFKLIYNHTQNNENTL